MKRVLITGASGFIGRYLVEALKKDYDVTGLTSKDGAIENPALLQALQSHRFDHVFHLASRSFVPQSWDDPYGYLNANIMGTVNVLELCRKQGAQLIYVSSYLYGHPQSLPIGEKADIHTLNPYALSKAKAEDIVHFYARYYNVQTVVIRPFNIYGPFQKLNFLIPTLISQAIKLEKIEVNDIRPKRDFLYIDDFIEALSLTPQVTTNFEIINIGYGKSYSIEEIVTTIETVLGKPIKILNRNIERPNEIFDVVADISKASNLLGWVPKTALATGIERTIERWEERS